MGDNFQEFIQQIPRQVYNAGKAHISENVAIFKPESIIVNQTICSDNYNFILPSFALPPAKIGRRQIEFQHENLIAIGSEVDFLCTKEVPTREYTNITIQKAFLGDIAADVSGNHFDFDNVKYNASAQLLQIVSDLEFELTNFGDCPQMVNSIAAQMIIQLLRDTGNYTRPAKCALQENTVSLLRTNVNPMYFIILTTCNKYLPDEMKLTPREIEITAYLLDRFDYDTIANSLVVSTNTVKSHVKHIYDKLKVQGKKDLGQKIMDLYYQHSL